MINSFVINTSYLDEHSIFFIFSTVCMFSNLQVPLRKLNIFRTQYHLLNSKLNDINNILGLQLFMSLSYNLVSLIFYMLSCLTLTVNENKQIRIPGVIAHTINFILLMWVGFIISSKVKNTIICMF